MGGSHPKPGWGEVGSHPFRVTPGGPADYMYYMKGGRAPPSFDTSDDAAYGRNPNGEFTTMKTPGVRDQDVVDLERRGDGDKEPALYAAPAAVDWDRKPGEIEVIETDRSSSIANIDFSDLKKWTVAQGESTSCRGHPDIQLNNAAENTLRVQMFDMETGQINWDSVYFLNKPGIIDRNTKELGNKGLFQSMWTNQKMEASCEDKPRREGLMTQAFGRIGAVKAAKEKKNSMMQGFETPCIPKQPEVPEGGWTSFSRLSIPKGDVSTHHYEVRVSKYPPSHVQPGHSGDVDEEDGMEGNIVGTAHFNVRVVDDLTTPDESSARVDADALKGMMSNQMMPEFLLAAMPLDLKRARRSRENSAASHRALRRRRQNDFWSGLSVSRALEGNISSKANFL